MELKFITTSSPSLSSHHDDNKLMFLNFKKKISNTKKQDDDYKIQVNPVSFEQPIPDESIVLHQFNEILNDLGLNSKVQSSLRDLSLEKKWQLICIRESRSHLLVRKVILILYFCLS